MKFPLERKDLKGYFIECDGDNSEDYEYKHLSEEELIEKMYLMAKDIEGDFAYHIGYDLDPKYESLVGMTISYRWCIACGFYAELAIRYSDNRNDWEKHSILLDNIPMKRYGSVEMHDISVVIDKGVSLYNEVFDKEKSNK